MHFKLHVILYKKKSEWNSKYELLSGTVETYIVSLGLEGRHSFNQDIIIMSMATAGSLRGIGVPVKLLHEAEGHVVTVGSVDAAVGLVLLRGV